MSLGKSQREGEGRLGDALQLMSRRHVARSEEIFFKLLKIEEGRREREREREREKREKESVEKKRGERKASKDRMKCRDRDGQTVANYIK